MPIAKTLAVLSTSIATLVCHAKELPMNDTKTYCIGRYLVDLPAYAETDGQRSQYRFGRIATDTSIKTASGFRQKMEEREVELKIGKQKTKYALAGILRPSPTSRIFELSKELITGPSAGFDAYVWDDGRTFSMEETAYDPAKFGDILSALQRDLLPNLRARSPGKTPSEPGFCLEDGFISNDGATRQFEDAAITFEFAQWPGVWVSVETTTVTKLGEPSLLQRIDGSGVWEAYKDVVSQVKTLRRGQRTINGRAGEEFLVTIPTDGGYRLHQFHWEAQGTEIGNGLEPTLTVEFESGMTRENGVPVRPRLTDEQAVALFDAVANSVRLRPVTGAMVSAAKTSPKPPLGTLAQTGVPCPQTGWWTCPEAVANEIEGGRRQRFEAGTPMPVVKVLPKRSVLERLSGRQRTHNVNTVWKLIAYDADADHT
jgi:hypothetical protein